MAWSEYDLQERELLQRDFSVSEVVEALESLKTNKSAGPDGVRNEHLKSALGLAPCWAALFNKCLRSGSIPAQWMDATLLVIPKGKGNPTEPSAWRGIAKKSACYKLLSLLITKRLSLFLERKDVIPEEQHGFRRNRSTISACKILLEDIQQALSKPRRYLYAVFVDFKAAFDTAPRDLILDSLAAAGVPACMLNLIAAVLKENRIVIDDGVSELPPIPQTTGVAQGNNISPLLFSVLLKDFSESVCGPRGLVKVLLYADDLVIYGPSRFQLQQALARLHQAVSELGLTVNLAKTEAVKFRRGGRVATNDALHLTSSAITYVNSFCYLGLLLPSNGHSFPAHLTERCRKALIAAGSIRSPQRLSLATAIRLFDLKVAPVATYGIEVIWRDMTAKNFDQLNRVKASFLKLALGLHRTAQNRLVYLLSGTPLLSEDLRQRFGLPETTAFLEHLRSWERKFAEIDVEFYNAGANLSDTWKELDRPNRHVVTRFAVHGFHHVLCAESGYHEPGSNCACQRCGSPCDKYHAARCALVPSLASLSRGE